MAHEVRREADGQVTRFYLLVNGTEYATATVIRGERSTVYWNAPKAFSSAELAIALGEGFAALGRAVQAEAQ